LIRATRRRIGARVERECRISQGRQWSGAAHAIRRVGSSRTPM
jgi:hypothetical protein